MVSGPRARDVLKTWHGLVHQVQSHLVQVPVATGSTLESLYIFGSGGPGPAEEPPDPGLTLCRIKCGDGCCLLPHQP